MKVSPTGRNALHFIGGIVLVVVGHLLFLGLVLVGLIVWSAYFPPPSKSQYWQIGVLVVSLMGLGIFQLLYVVPLALYFRRRQLTLAWQAVVVAAALTLLGSGICGGMSLF